MKNRIRQRENRRKYLQIESKTNEKAQQTFEDNSNKGLQKVRDGEQLGGKVSAEVDFANEDDKKHHT